MAHDSEAIIYALVLKFGRPLIRHTPLRARLYAVCAPPGFLVSRYMCWGACRFYPWRGISASCIQTYRTGRFMKILNLASSQLFFELEIPGLPKSNDEMDKYSEYTLQAQNSFPRSECNIAGFVS